MKDRKNKMEILGFGNKLLISGFIFCFSSVYFYYLLYKNITSILCLQINTLKNGIDCISIISFGYSFVHFDYFLGFSCT